MSKKLEDRTEDYLKWFMYNRDQNGDVIQRLKFAETALYNMAILLAVTTHDVKALEGREDTYLFLPDGLKWNGK